MFAAKRHFTHFLPVILVYILIITLVYVFFVQYIFLGDLSKLKILSATFVSFCAIMTIYCHLKSMLTNPGSIEPSKIKPNQENNNTIKHPGFFFKSFCEKCKQNRPERSHHCKICNRCFLKMDHHCPWIGNCVGLYNQKYFFLFLFYSTIGCLFIFICFANNLYKYEFEPNPMCKDGNYLYTFFRVFWFLQYFAKYQGFIIFLQIFCNIRDLLCATFGGVIALSMTIGIGLLLCYQFYLFLYNKTTIENLRLKRGQNTPYYYNSKIKNLRTVFGEGSILNWFWPSIEPNTYNEGYESYPKPNIDLFIKNEEFNKQIKNNSENFEETED